MEVPGLGFPFSAFFCRGGDFGELRLKDAGGKLSGWTIRGDWWWEGKLVFSGDQSFIVRLGLEVRGSLGVCGDGLIPVLRRVETSIGRFQWIRQGLGSLIFYCLVNCAKTELFQRICDHVLYAVNFMVCWWCILSRALSGPVLASLGNRLGESRTREVRALAR